MTIWAIVPVKPLRRGKSRLAGLLTEEQRTGLNRYLLEHTLTILNKISDIEHTLVVSRDPAALALTRSMGGRTVLEDGAPQFNTAIQRATIVAQSQGARAVLILPADLPLVEPADLEALLSQGQAAPVVVIAPDRRRGRNERVIYQPGRIDRIWLWARLFPAPLLSVPPRPVPPWWWLRSDRIGLDLDLPEDLEIVGGLKGLKLE
jgi:2-phospho-L-lactate guanylyltransferase